MEPNLARSTASKVRERAQKQFVSTELLVGTERLFHAFRNGN